MQSPEAVSRSESTRLTLTVSMEVTVPQALALKAMFDYWNKLASWGSSRYVGFMVDGDGNFKPKCAVSTSVPLPELTDELRNIAAQNVSVQRRENNEEVDNCMFDFDPIAWRINK